MLPLSEHYEFGDTLNDMLRDRLVWGIDDAKVQHRLLAEGSLTFAKALEIAQASELASRDLKDLQAGGGGPTVNKVQGKSPMPSRPAPKGTLACFRCGGNHTAAHCQFKGKCRACGKLGHIAKLCRSKRPPSTPHQQRDSVHQVEDTAPLDEYTLYPVFVHHQEVVTPLTSTVIVEGKPLCRRLTPVPLCP